MTFSTKFKPGIIFLLILYTFSHVHRVAISLFTLWKAQTNENSLKNKKIQGKISYFVHHDLAIQLTANASPQHSNPNLARKKTPRRVVLTCRRCQTLTTGLTLVACGTLSSAFESVLHVLFFHTTE